MNFSEYLHNLLLKSHPSHPLNLLLFPPKCKNTEVQYMYKQTKTKSKAHISYAKVNLYFRKCLVNSITAVCIVWLTSVTLLESFKNSFTPHQMSLAAMQ